MKEVGLAPDEGAVEEFVSAGLYPAFRDRVHAGHAVAGGDDLDAFGLEGGVERPGELAVAVPGQASDGGAGVLDVHDEVPPGLGGPVRGGVGGCAGGADAAACVLGDGEDVNDPSLKRRVVDVVEGSVRSYQR
ncbi:hypothetical protein ACH4PR_47940 [Streptomyces mirabilis]|uniref:hypothetical protein n=1 Tax=Streptomyces mirabilis TaxID=68239 RepID=UPI0037B0C67A